MTVTIRPSTILSRVAAVLLVALPLAYLGVTLQELEAADVRRMSDAEVRQYVLGGHDLRLFATYLQVAAVTAVYVAAVEAVAFVLRLAAHAVGLTEPSQTSCRETDHVG